MYWTTRPLDWITVQRPQPTLPPPAPHPPTRDQGISQDGRAGDPPAPVLVPMLMTYGGHHWRPVQTCSLNFTIQALPVVTPCGHSRSYGQHKWAVHFLQECFLVENEIFAGSFRVNLFIHLGIHVTWRQGSGSLFQPIYPNSGWRRFNIWEWMIRR